MSANNKKILYIIILMHTLFFISAITFLKIQKEKNISKYLKQFYLSNEIAFNKDIKILNKNMDLLEKLLINKDILNIVKNAQIDLNTSRTKLINSFLPKYKMLKNNGFYLIHFHLNNGTSFVRFHKLNKYGDYLLDFRPSIKYVQSTKKVFHGFEIGRGVGGFRSVYPLIINNKLVGSFEISFSINNLIEYMFSKQHIAMIVEKKIVDNKVFQKNIVKFKNCKLNNNYYIWGNGCKLFKKTHFVDFQKKINIIENNIIFSYPIYDMYKKKEGYLLSIFPMKELKVIDELNKNFNTMLLIVTILYFIILLIIFAIYFYFKLKVKSETDHLTKVLNRAGCQNKINSLKDYVLIIIDIDFFKKINDTYGHDKGDMVLAELSNLLSKYVRENDIVCRWGGEEFLVILPNTTLEDGVKIAEKLRNIIQNYDFEDLKITISEGVALSDGNFDSTFKKADNNLYKAKNSGRNKVVYK